MTGKDGVDYIDEQLTGTIIIIIENGRTIVARYCETGSMRLGIERAYNWQEIEPDAHAAIMQQLATEGLGGIVHNRELITSCPESIANMAVFT